MPKLNNFNSGQENMRNLTHLKLDPIDQSFQGNVQHYINQQIDPSQVANRAGAASTQFQKGMLTNLAATYIQQLDA